MGILTIFPVWFVNALKLWFSPKICKAYWNKNVLYNVHPLTLQGKLGPGPTGVNELHPDPYSPLSPPPCLYIYIIHSQKPTYVEKKNLLIVYTLVVGRVVTWGLSVG